MNGQQQTELPGAWLKAQLERRRITARQLAASLDVLPQSVYNWLSGKTGIDDDRAEQIAHVLGMALIDVRRGLGLWVPDDSGNLYDGSERRHDRYEEMRERIRGASGIPRSEKERRLAWVDRLQVQQGTLDESLDELDPKR